MTAPNDPQQPWWARPGGAPPPGAVPFPPPPPASPSPRPAYPPAPPPPHRHRMPPAPNPPAPQQKNSNRNLLVIAGMIATVIVIGVAAVGVWAWKSNSGTVIEVGQAEAGVRQILSDPINGYGANTISALRCNDGKNPSAAKGDSFTCEVEINGAVRHVNVIFQDDKGTFAVDGPR